ncbi:MAG: hypothetical protein KDB23_22405, partial [Planctomycetales bacterium]|nr:hypothetical protein [Planctomycetales bacterium]
MKDATRNMTVVLLATLTLTVAASPVRAQQSLPTASIAQQINAANELVRQGQNDSAIALYRQLPAGTVEQDELNYNLAVANYRNGDLAEAQRLFATTASVANTRIAADSRYNLGNCQYAAALKAAEQDKPAAIAGLREAIGNYRSSLRLSDNNPDARANIELAAELIRKLEEQQEQEQQQQDQQQQDQRQQDQQQQNQQQQNQQQQNQNQPQNQAQQSQSQQNQQQQTQQSQDGQGEQDESKSEQQQSQQRADEQKQPHSQQNSEEQSSEQKPEPNGEQLEQQQPDAAQPQQQNQADAQTPQTTRNSTQQRQTRNTEAATAAAAANAEQTKDSPPVPTGELTAAGQDQDLES